MTAAKTPSQRGRANRNRGHQAERDVCRYLRDHGWPHAERAVRAGFRTTDRTSADPGDITGTVGIVWSVKDCAVEQHTKWRDELDAMQQDHPDPATVGLILHKRRGHADPGEWWCWIGICDLAHLLPGALGFYGPQWFRTTLDELVPLLRAAGYGTPAEVAS